MNLKYNTKKDLINDMKRILELIEKEDDVENNEDAQKSGFSDINEYNYIVELIDEIENYVEKAKRTNDLYGKELSEKDIDGLKETYIHIKLWRKMVKEEKIAKNFYEWRTK